MTYATVKKGSSAYMVRQCPISSALWSPVLALLLQLAGCQGSCTSVQPIPDQSFENSIGMTMVKLSTGYYVSRFETRQSEFEAVMGYNPSESIGPNRPVENLTGDEVREFCSRLTQRERSRGQLPEGFIYSLPSCKQWLEYVADAPLDGSITPSGSPDLRGDSPVNVEKGEVNCLGLYNLRGNVCEWSRDPYNTGSLTILGAWWNERRKDFLDVKNRAGMKSPKSKGGHVGFRCVLIPKGEIGDFTEGKGSITKAPGKTGRECQRQCEDVGLQPVRKYSAAWAAWPGGTGRGGQLAPATAEEDGFMQHVGEDPP